MQEAGNKEVQKKSVPASLQLMVWRKIQDRKAANVEVGMGQTTNWNTDSFLMRKRYTVGNFWHLFVKKKYICHTPSMPTYISWNIILLNKCLICHPSREAWPKMHRRATQWMLAKWIVFFLSFSLCKAGSYKSSKLH